MTEHMHSRSVAAIVAAGLQRHPPLALCAASPRIRFQAGRSPNGYHIGSFHISTQPSALSHALVGDSAVLTVEVNGKRCCPPHSNVLQCLEGHVWWWLQRVGGPISLRLADCTADSVGEPTTAFAAQIRELRYTGGMLPWLSFCTQLVALDISRTTLSSIDSINSCRSLERLNIAFCKGITDLSVINRLYNLKELDMWGTCVVNLDWIHSCSSLEILKISGGGASSFSVIGRLQKLTDLDMWATVGNIEWIHGCSSLERLKIISCKGITNFSAIGHLHNLKDLVITYSSVGSIDWIDGCSHLEVLSVIGCKGITDFSVISSLHNLKHIDMTNSGVENIDWIGDCGSLEVLNICDCEGITDFSAISRMPLVAALGYDTSV